MISNDSRNIIIFGLVALGSGWIGLLLDQWIEQTDEAETLGMGLWLIMPLLTVLALHWFGGESWDLKKYLPAFSSNWAWYGAGIVVFPLVTVLVLILGYLLGWIDFSAFRGEIYFSTLLSAFLPNFIKNIFEETVWRGYLTQKLVDRGLSDKAIYVVVGLVWGLWHLPYYLYFLPLEQIQQILNVDRLTFALLAVFSMTCWSVLFVEIYRVTGTIWGVVLLHSVEDSVINHLVINGHIQIGTGKAIWISPICGLITTVLYLIVGLLIRKIRRRGERQQAAEWAIEDS